MSRKLFSYFVKKIYYLIWKLSFFIETIKMKRRFNNRAEVIGLHIGNGEMFKFIITFSNGNSFLIKKINFLGEFWLKMGNAFASEFTTSHKILVKWYLC